MRPRRGQVMRLTVPLRVLVQRFAYVLLIGAAFGLMLLGKAETHLAERARAAAADVVAPIMDALSRPAATVAGVIEGARELVHLRAENAQLRAQNERLLTWQQTAERLAEQNEALKLLLGYVPEPGAHGIAARVIADSGGVFVRSMLVNAGARHGIARGRAVVTGSGLVGRIAAVGELSARVLLITDLNSRIPVVAETTRDRAILAGDNSDRPRLVFLPPGASVAPGARIVTSGHGGMFPPGVPVGEVVRSDGDVLRVIPYAGLDRLEYVQILDFQAPAMAELGQAGRGRVR